MVDELVFKKAIVLDAETKSVWIYNNGNVKIYSKIFYEELIELISERVKGW